MRRLYKFHRALFGRGKQNVEVFDARVEAPLLELRENPLGVVLVVGRAYMVWPRRKPLHVCFQVRGVGNGFELGFPGAFGGGGIGGKPLQGGCVRRSPEKQNARECDDAKLIFHGLAKKYECTAVERKAPKPAPVL